MATTNVTPLQSCQCACGELRAVITAALDLTRDLPCPSLIQDPGEFQACYLDAADRLLCLLNVSEDMAKRLRDHLDDVEAEQWAARKEG